MQSPRPIPLPTLRQLEYVVAIADEKNFGLAAARCHVSQPGLSAQVREVEQLLGARLFERDRRGVLVTAVGEDVIERSRALLAAARDLVEAARRRTRPLTGPLRIGVIPTIAPYWLPAALPSVRRDYPELKMVLREEKTAVLVELVARGHLDVALLAIDVPLGNMETALLFDDAFVLAMPAGHPLARKKLVVEADLDGQCVLLLEDGHCLREQAFAVCSRAGATEDVDLRATSLATLMQMVAGGDGITLLPAMAEAAMAGPGSGVVTRPFRAPAPHRRIGLAWRRGSSRAAEMQLLAKSLLAAPPGS